MSETKDFKKGNGERSENGNGEDTEDVEGYAYCATYKQKCLNDCVGGGPAISCLNWGLKKLVAKMIGEKDGIFEIRKWQTKKQQKTLVG